MRKETGAGRWDMEINHRLDEEPEEGEQDWKLVEFEKVNEQTLKEAIIEKWEIRWMKWYE